MSALAHSGPIVALPVRRRHLTLVPPPAAAPERREPAAAALPARPTPAAVPAGAPVHLTSRGKRVLAALLILAAGALGSIGGAVLASAEPSTAAVTTVTVSSGDTLWSIAAEVAAPGDDIRDVMVQIAEMNGLQGSVLPAGQQLEVPTVD